MPYYPAIVKSYDATSHRARIKIPGFTDGADTFPEAEILYSIGDLHSDTEILIRPGDKVYIDWIVEGDIRTPIIVGYRNPLQGNLVGARRIRQKVIELIATEKLIIEAPTFETKTTNTQLNHQQLTAVGTNTLQGQTNLDGGATTTKGETPVITGGLQVNGGEVKHNDKNIGDSHTHTSTAPGTPTTVPN